MIFVETNPSKFLSGIASLELRFGKFEIKVLALLFSTFSIEITAVEKLRLIFSQSSTIKNAFSLSLNALHFNVMGLAA